MQWLRRIGRGARLSALAAALRARGAEQASAITGRGAYSSMQRHRRFHSLNIIATSIAYVYAIMLPKYSDQQVNVSDNQ